MTPVPRSTDTHNHHHHHHHHHHHRLMNIQTIQKASVTSRQLSGDSAITNSDNYCGGLSSNGPKEGQLLGDYKDLKKRPSNNFSSSTTSSSSSSRKTPFTTTSGAPATQNPVEGSLIVSSKNTVAAVATPKAKQYNDAHVQYKYVAIASTASSVAVPIVSTQPSLAANSKLDLIEKSSPIASAALNITGGNNKKYNGVVATEAWTSPMHRSSLVTPPFSSAGLAVSDASNVGIESASQSQTTSSTNMVHGIRNGSLSLTDTGTAGIKRKISPTIATMNSSPAGGSSLPLLRRRDSQAMELRNKKMKAADCFIFAATLLEDESLMTTRINNALPFTTEPSANVLSCTAESPPSTKMKPMKKMVCEKVERDLQEAAEQRRRQHQQQQHQQEKQRQRQQQQQEEGGDAENKPKEADVLCGRGGKVNKHAGNIVYRKVVEYNKSYYQSVHKKHRILVSQSIVKAIINYGGRFMGRKGKEWSPICFKKAVQKTSQALRERSNKSDVLLGEHELIGTTEILKK